MTPNLTPFEADRLCRISIDDTIEVDGWVYTLDGPSFSPREFQAPIAFLVGDYDEAMYVNGEPGEKVTEASYWVGPF